MEAKNKWKRTKKNSPTIKLEPFENLLIWRRRIGWRQLQAAKYFKISLYDYKMTEYGKLSIDKLKNIGPADLSWELTDNERCLIYRKRKNKTQLEVAKDIGICRSWLRSQESGVVPCTQLLKHWENGS